MKIKKEPKYDKPIIENNKVENNIKKDRKKWNCNIDNNLNLLCIQGNNIPIFNIIQNSLNQFDVFYLGIFTFTIGLFMKDLSYKKKIDKLLENGTLSRRTTRALEIFIIIASMVLFKDVDVATGDVGFPLYAFVH